MAKVTQEQLQQNSGANGVYWTAINGTVYDFTDFVHEHPGGAKIIRLAGGRDSTILFESHHLEKSQAVVTKALQQKLEVVGEFVGEREGGNPKFFTTLRRRVQERLRSLQITQHYGTKWILTESLVCALLYLVATYFTSVHGSFVWAAFLGLVTGRLGFLMHSGNHASASQSKNINVLVGMCMNLIGGSSLVWRYQHQVSHHMYPNDPARDKDCHSGKPMLRLHNQHKYYFWHRINPLTVATAMSAFLIKWFFSDILRIFVPVMAGTRVEMTFWDRLGLILTKVQWLILHVAIPWHLHGLTLALQLAAVKMAVGAYYLGGTFIVNHIQEGLVADPKRHWAERQVLASANWASGSFFYNWLSGGLNHQIEHHIFPSMSIYVYPYIQDIVEKTSKDFGMPYRTYPSFSNALWHTAKFLYSLSCAKLKGM